MSAIDTLKATASAILDYKDNGMISQPPYFNVPTAYELGCKTNKIDIQKEDLIKYAILGKVFNITMHLSMANYTLGASEHFGRALEDGFDIHSSWIDEVQNNIYVLKINNNGSIYTQKRLAAAEDLIGIMRTAKQKKCLNEVCEIIGYFDKGASLNSSIMNIFGTSFENSDENPQEIFSRNKYELEKLDVLTINAEAAVKALPPDMQDEISIFIGRHGYEALNDSKIIRKPANDGELTEKPFDLPSRPFFGKNNFYRAFGKNLMREYGLLIETSNEELQ